MSLQTLGLKEHEANSSCCHSSRTEQNQPNPPLKKLFLRRKTFSKLPPNSSWRYMAFSTKPFSQRAIQGSGPDRVGQADICVFHRNGSGPRWLELDWGLVYLQVLLEFPDSQVRPASKDFGPSLFFFNLSSFLEMVKLQFCICQFLRAILHLILMRKTNMENGAKMFSDHHPPAPNVTSAHLCARKMKIFEISV